MRFEDIENMWKEDSVIDPDDLHIEALKIPQLHSKYYEIQNKVYALKKVKEAEYSDLYKRKFLYYSGKEVDSNNPFPYKILKTDVPVFLESDEELVKAKAKVGYCEYLLGYLADIIKMIHSRSFQIRDSIEWSRFVAGQ